MSDGSLGWLSTAPLRSGFCPKQCCLDHLDNACETPGTAVPFLHIGSSEKLETCPRFHSCFWKELGFKPPICLILKYTIFFPHPHMGTDFLLCPQTLLLCKLHPILTLFLLFSTFTVQKANFAHQPLHLHLPTAPPSHPDHWNKTKTQMVGSATKLNCLHVQMAGDRVKENITFAYQGYIIC